MVYSDTYFHPTFNTHQTALPVRHKHKSAVKTVIEICGFMMLIDEILLENLWELLLNCFAKVFYTFCFKIVIIDLSTLTINDHY